MEAGSEGAVKNWQHQRVHRAPFRSRRTRLSPGLEKQHLRLRRHARGAGARGRDHPPDLELEQGQPPPPTARPAPAQEPQPVSHQSNPWQEPGAPAPPIGCALVRANSPGQGADGEHVATGRRGRPGAEERGGIGVGARWAEGDVGRGAGEEFPPGDKQGPVLQPRHRLSLTWARGRVGGAAKSISESSLKKSLT
jgi:hypothetical protein